MPAAAVVHHRHRINTDTGITGMSQQRRDEVEISPFAGGPPTTMGWDENGTLTFTVTPREMTPERLETYELLGYTAILALMIAAFAVYWHFRADASPWLLVAALVGPPVLVRIYALRLYDLLKKRTEVVFTPTEFRVARHWGWAVYDRTLTHRFVMMRHDRTREEEEKREMEARKAAQEGKIINPPRYYSDSFHIVFEYLGQRHDVLDVYDKNCALAVVSRFKACDQVMDNHARMGEGEPLNPDDQWGRQPGDVPG